MNQAKKVTHGAAHGARVLRWRVQNWKRGRGDAPEYVLFLLEGALPELGPPRDKWWQQLLPGDDESLRKLAARFDQVAGDPRVAGVVLHLRPLTMPLAQLQTLRGMIERLRAAGKRVVVWSHGYDTAAYYLACAADELLVQPGGIVAPVGLNREMLFLKETLAEAGIEMDAVQISPFKSGPDMFTRSQSTEQTRAMANWLIEDAFDDLLRGIAAGRGISLEAARALVDAAPYTDLQALEAGVVDGVLNEEALPAHLARGHRAATLKPWPSAHKTLLLPRPSPKGRAVALLRIEGMIVPGQSRRPPFKAPLPLPIFTEEQSGDLSVVQQVRAVLDNDEVAAVVLYVDSPGGSAAASEAMASALEQLAAKKPLVVAMGAVAASGGYYVATPAQWIVAQPGTITGSIGVYTLKPVVRGLLDKLQVGREQVARGEHATIWDPEAPFTEAERHKMWENIVRTYELFLERVARGRGMTTEAVDAIAGGRVWTGQQAHERGLVDELGSLDDALRKARQLAALPHDAPLLAATGPKSPLPPLALDPKAALAALRYSPADPLCLSPLWVRG